MPCCVGLSVDMKGDVSFYRLSIFDSTDLNWRRRPLDFPSLVAGGDEGLERTQRPLYSLGQPLMFTPIYILTIGWGLRIGLGTSLGTRLNP